jgi:hypothetical protein
MSATADYLVNKSPSFNSVVMAMPMALPFLCAPDSVIGAPYHRPNFRAPTVSGVAMLADKWISSRMDDYAAWFRLEETYAATVAAEGAWKKYVSDAKADTDVDTLSETIESVFEILSTLGPKAIVLSNFTPNNVNGEHLAAVLRVTAPHRADIPGWSIALRTAMQALEIAGLDPQDALAGLLEA